MQLETQNRFQSCSEYWTIHKGHLPILSSFVRKYNIICATLVDCENAFSVADFLHRRNRSSLAPSTLRYSMVLREPIKNKSI